MLLRVDGSAGQTALGVTAGDTSLGGDLGVSGTVLLASGLGPAGLCQGVLQGACPVAEIDATQMLLRRTVRASASLVAEAGLTLTSSSLDASGSGGLQLSLPVDNAAALRLVEAGQPLSSAMLTVDTLNGKVSTPSLTAGNFVASDGEISLAPSGAITSGIITVPSGAASALTIRSQVLGVSTTHLTVDSAASVVSASALSAPKVSAGSLRLGVAEVTAADSIVVPGTASVVRVLAAASVFQNYYTLQSPGSSAAGHNLLLVNHASTQLRHSSSSLPVVAAGHAAQFVFLGGTSWLMLQSTAVVGLT